MHIFNPCNKCLIKVCCSTECNEHYQYTVTRNQLTYIPNLIRDMYNSIYREIKWMYRGEPIFIKFWLTLLLIAQGFNLVILIGLICAGFKMVVS